MIAAVYARKSTDQHVTDEERTAGLNESLKVACDGFHQLDADFTALWRK